MTEKRFTYKGITATDIEVYDYNKVIGQFRHDMMTGNSLENMTNLMNALHEENQQLLKDRKEMFIRERDTKNELRELKKNCKNYKWYKQYKQLCNDEEQYKILVNELKKQNQKLKGRLKDLGVEYYD